MDKCETCRWWGGRVSGRVYDPGPCRRYPPQVVIRDQFQDVHFIQPKMSINDFCGEHTPKDRP